MAIFGSSQNKTVATYDTEAAKVVTLIGASAVLEGDFRSKDSTRVDGVINGDVSIEGTLIVGQNGSVTGDVTADNVFLAGTITGAINAGNGKIEISDTGKVVGDITTKSLVIDENAIFQGQCNMSSAQEEREREAPRESVQSRDEDD